MTLPGAQATVDGDSADLERSDRTWRSATTGSASSPRARAREHLIGSLLAAPAFLLVFGLLVYPVAYALWLSLSGSHYRHLFADALFWRAACNTAALVLLTALVELVVGVLTALLLWWRFWGRAFVFLSVFVPWAFPATFSAFAWYWLLMPPFSAFYALHILPLRLGLEGLFGMGAWQVLAIAVMNVWRGSSIIAVFLLAGFNAIPEELLDVSKLEAPGPWQYFWRVVVPLSRRFLILAALVALVVTYVEYASMYLETGGRITVPVLGTLAFREAIQNGNAGLGAALALIPLPIAVALVIGCLRLLEGRAPRPAAPEPPGEPPNEPRIRRRRAGPNARRSIPASGPSPRFRPLRRLALLTAGGVAALVVTGFHLFPVYYTAVQALRSVKEYARGNPFWVYEPTFDELLGVVGNPVLWVWARNTLVIFGAVVLVGLAVSVLAGWALARFPLPGGCWLARLMFFSYFIPQMAVVVPVYQLFLPWGLDDSVLGIVLLYLTLAIPFATWLFYIYFRGLPSDVEDHALLDGSRAQVFLRVVLPMSWPVIIAAGLFAVGMMGADVLYASTFSLTDATKTLPAGLGLTAVDVEEWASANAAILLSSLPIIVLCAALSPSYVRGLRAALIEGA